MRTTIIASHFAAFAIGHFLLMGATARGESPNPTRSVLQAVEQAHAELWNRRIDRHGVILDFVGEIPTFEDCSLGRPNAIGWWSPIENGPMFTGLYLPAACERARRSGDPVDKANARRLALGLLKCASVSDVPGFVARGMGADGTCHYPLGSDDQTHPWFYGLHTYAMSGIPTAEERKQVADKMKEVADVLEATAWKCPCDGAFKGQFRGGFQGHLFRDAARYLFMLRAIYDVTGDRVWLERYRKALAERPAKSDKTRAEICAAGYGLDREAIKSIDEYSLWIYVGSQGSLAKLVAMESDESLQAKYREGLAVNAKNALAAIEAHREFDNNDTKVFGHANWRAVYTTWFPQRTQADALKLSETGDKAKRGERKLYEARYMRNPLAAAAIVALAGEDAGRDAVERAIRHYDYAKLHMSEFFFAECAYYALPKRLGAGAGRDTVPSSSLLANARESMLGFFFSKSDSRPRNGVRAYPRAPLPLPQTINPMRPVFVTMAVIPVISSLSMTARAESGAWSPRRRRLLPQIHFVLSAMMLCFAHPALGVESSPAASLQGAAADLFPIGVAISNGISARPTEWPLLTAQFSSVTAENCLKPDPVQTAEGKFNFNEADALVDFAAAKGLQVEGHCLVWAKDDRTPPWFFQEGGKDASSELLLQRMKTHIDTVVGRYRGRIAMWDVVNEALDDGPALLRPSGWSTRCGEEFIAKAFEFAHQADPNALLVYNDYNTELPSKRAKLLQLVRSLREKNVPIHAIGLQGHYEIDQVPLTEIEVTLVEMRKLGIKVVISELDLDVIPRGRWWADGGKHREELSRLNPYRDGCPPEILQRQAQQYAQLFGLFRKHADTIARVTFWNLHDGQSWLNDFPWKRVNHPLLFDRAGQPKPAFEAVIRTLSP